MTEQKHTPGPLTITVCARLAGEPCLIDGPDGDPVAQTEDHGHSIPEQHANARLIAAAPEMLSMLHECADFVQPFNRAEELLDRIEVLIAKATGGSHDKE